LQLILGSEVDYFAKGEYQKIW